MTITDSDKAHLATLPAELRAAIHGMLDRSYREGRADLTGANLTGATVSPGSAIPGWTATTLSCQCCATLTRTVAS